MRDAQKKPTSPPSPGLLLSSAGDARMKFGSPGRGELSISSTSSRCLADWPSKREVATEPVEGRKGEKRSLASAFPNIPHRLISYSTHLIPLLRSMDVESDGAIGLRTGRSRFAPGALPPRSWSKYFPAGVCWKGIGGERRRSWCIRLVCSLTDPVFSSSCTTS